MKAQLRIIFVLIENLGAFVMLVWISNSFSGGQYLIFWTFRYNFHNAATTNFRIMQTARRQQTGFTLQMVYLLLNTLFRYLLFQWREALGGSCSSRNVLACAMSSQTRCGWPLRFCNDIANMDSIYPIYLQYHCKSFAFEALRMFFIRSICEVRQWHIVALHTMFLSPHHRSL